MDYRPSNSSNNNNGVVGNMSAAGRRKGYIVDILDEAENIVLGLKALDTSERHEMLYPPLRIGRPILEPLDSSMEPTPLGPSALIPKLLQRSGASAGMFAGNFPKWMPQPDMQQSQPQQPLPVGQMQRASQQQRPQHRADEHNFDLSFSNLDDTPLSLEYIDDLETSPALVASACLPLQEAGDSASLTSQQVKKRRVRKYKEDQWNFRFQDLLQFRAEEGHVMVPHSYPKNQKLAQWVKR